MTGIDRQAVVRQIDLGIDAEQIEQRPVRELPIHELGIGGRGIAAVVDQNELAAAVGLHRPRRRPLVECARGVVERGRALLAVERCRQFVAVMLVEVVVVPDDEPRMLLVRAQIVRIAAPERVAAAQLGEVQPVAVVDVGGVLDAVARPHALVEIYEIVDVIAEMDDEIEIVARRDVAEAAPVTRPVTGTGQHREADFIDVRGRRGARAADDRTVPERAEAVVVSGRRLQAGDVDFHRPVAIRVRCLPAAPDDVPEFDVRGDDPAHRNFRGARRDFGDARPDDHAVGHRIAAGHAVRERKPCAGRKVEPGRRREAVVKLANEVIRRSGVRFASDQGRGRAERAQGFQEFATGWRHGGRSTLAWGSAGCSGILHTVRFPFRDGFAHRHVPYHRRPPIACFPS